MVVSKNKEFLFFAFYKFFVFLQKIGSKEQKNVDTKRMLILIIFGTKTTKNEILRIKLLPKIILWIFFTPIWSFFEVFKIQDFGILLYILSNK